MGDLGLGQVARVPQGDNLALTGPERREHLLERDRVQEGGDGIAGLGWRLCSLQLGRPAATVADSVGLVAGDRRQPRLPVLRHASRTAGAPGAYQRLLNRFLGVVAVAQDAPRLAQATPPRALPIPISSNHCSDFLVR